MRRAALVLVPLLVGCASVRDAAELAYRGARGQVLQFYLCPDSVQSRWVREKDMFKKPLVCAPTTPAPPAKGKAKR